MPPVWVWVLRRMPLIEGVPEAESGDIVLSEPGKRHAGRRRAVASLCRFSSPAHHTVVPPYLSLCADVAGAGSTEVC